MKKRLICLSVAAALGGIAGAASAQQPLGSSNFLSFNNDGVGHIVIVPYFTTQGGNATLFNIVNTDQVNGKAVKVRFRGASNSDDVFDFQLFMSPGDVWTANISQAASGLSKLTTSDRSCTLPSNVNQEFITSRLNTVDLSGDELANETREGYIEILNMADIPSSSSTSSIYAVTKHNTAGSPSCTASVLESLTRFDTRLVLPTTGLFANWTIINVPQTTTWAGEGSTLQAQVTTGVSGTGNHAYFPQTAVALAPGDVTAYTADPLFIAGLVAGASYDLPDLSTPYTSVVASPIEQATDLSDALAVRSVANEYLSDPTISASTDWVVSKPTRRYYVAVDYSATTPADRLVTNFDDNSLSQADYYRSKLSDGSAAGNTVMGNSSNGGHTWQACTQVSSVKFYNREELSPSSSGIVISPGQPAPAPSLCGEISVLSINSPNSPLKANVTRFTLTLPGGLVDGWGLLTADNNFAGNNLGLPMLVRQFSKAVNPAVSAGTSGTFGAKWTGRVTVRGDFFTN